MIDSRCCRASFCKMTTAATPFQSVNYICHYKSGFTVFATTEQTDFLVPQIQRLRQENLRLNTGRKRVHLK